MKNIEYDLALLEYVSGYLASGCCFVSDVMKVGWAMIFDVIAFV
jgi:hypothetical protein